MRAAAELVGAKVDLEDEAGDDRPPEPVARRDDHRSRDVDADAARVAAGTTTKPSAANLSAPNSNEGAK